MTGRPLCITYRPWGMAGRPMHDFDMHDMSNQYMELCQKNMKLHYAYWLHKLVTLF